MARSATEPDPVQPALERGGGEELADRGGAVEAQRPRGHRQERVVGEQRDDAVEVDGRPGVLEAAHDGGFGPASVGACAARAFPRSCSRWRRSRARCSALLTAGDGVVEELGDLARRPVEHVAQHEPRALLGRQQLHRGDEGEPDPLALLDDSSGPAAGEGSSSSSRSG